MSRRPRLSRLAIAAVLSLCALHAAAGPSIIVAPSCVVACVGSGSCDFFHPRCMCKAARHDFLANTLGCLVEQCASDDLAIADDNFLGTVDEICKHAGIPVPKSVMSSAQSVASCLLTPSVAADPPPGPDATRTPDSPSPPTPAPAPLAESAAPPPTVGPGLGEGGPRSSLSRASGPTPSSSLSSSTSASGRRSTSAQTTAAPASSSADAQAGSETADADNPDPTDSSPFATPNAAAGPCHFATAAAYVAAVAPLLAWVFV